MEREGEPWHLRLTVADKVSNGTVEGLYQDIEARGLQKGVVVTSTEFAPSGIESSKRPANCTG